jgi:guanylate kinase
MMLVLSSPSGAGKTTIARNLLRLDPALKLSISVTTRPKRPGEVDGADYHFLARVRYEEMIRDGELLEHAEVYEHGYGTPRADVEAALAGGRDVLFDIDWQGAQQLREVAGEDMVSIFILPPSMSELERRLRARAQDSEEVVRKRFAQAAIDVTRYDGYDYVLINCHVEESLQRVRAILTAERLRRLRQIGLAEFVRELAGH